MAGNILGGLGSTMAGGLRDRVELASSQVREPEVPAAMSAHERSVMSLEELVSHLEGRLAPVLSSAPPSDDANKATRGYNSGLAVAIASFTDRNEGLVSRLSLVLRRLELP